MTGKSRRHPIQARLDDDELAAVTAAVEAARDRGEDATPSDWLRRHGVAAAREAVEIAQEAADHAFTQREADRRDDLELDA